MRLRYEIAYAVVCITIFLIIGIIAWIFMENEIRYLALCLVVFGGIHFLLFSVEFDKEEICINHCYLFRRHITSDRISSIQLVAINSAPVLIVCIDGHRPYNDTFEFKWFYSSLKVIRMQLPFSREKREEYVTGLKALYGDKVIVEKSYKKCFEKK